MGERSPVMEVVSDVSFITGTASSVREAESLATCVLLPTESRFLVS